MDSPIDQNTEHPQNRLKAFRQRAGSRIKRSLPFASGMLAAFLALLMYNFLFPRTPQLTTREVNEAVAAAMASATPPPAFSARVYQAVQPSLVLIQAHIPEAGHPEGYSVGSGVIVNDRAEILTSLHVVDGADSIELVFADGTHTTGEVIAATPENDIAVLSPHQMPGLFAPAVLGNPNSMRVGDEAFAVGNPFGLYSSITSGVVSGFDRSFQPAESAYPLDGLIQIDAAVNPGNSGGPLLNRYGHVVGIVVGIVNPTEDEVFIGIGFAVPIEIAAAAAGSPPY